MGFESTSLRSFLEGLARDAREDAALMGMRLESSLDAVDDLWFPIDRSLLARAFENVVSNALHYTPEKGLVRLAARLHKGVFYIDIDDEGPGIPVNERETVFEPFYRGSAAREGSGLGLYIARSIVRGHGWEIEAGEAPGGGGRVSVLIPGHIGSGRNEEK